MSNLATRLTYNDQPTEGTKPPSDSRPTIRTNETCVDSEDAVTLAEKATIGSFINKIHLGNSANVMSQMPEGSVDLGNLCVNF